MKESYPKSSWVVKREYFLVDIVDSFAEKYVKWYLRDYDRYGVEIDSVEIDEVRNFASTLEKKKSLKVYEFPKEHADQESEFFEEGDDYYNYIIPAELLNLNNQREC